VLELFGLKFKKADFCGLVTSLKDSCGITVATVISQGFFFLSMFNKKWVFSRDPAHHDFFSLTVINQTHSWKIAGVETATIFL